MAQLGRNKRQVLLCLVVLVAITDAQTELESSTTTTAVPKTENVTSSSACPPHTCRMLCPYGFVTDSNGCEQCECYNPCKDVVCRRGDECHVDDSNCKPGEPCRPSTNCRKPRGSLGECAYGEPLSASGSSSRPLLCGNNQDKPNCPTGYDCTIQINAEYGLCCPQEQQTSRASECPSVIDASFQCDDKVKCSVDSDCNGTEKCCDTSCNKVCLPSRNSTACEQQRRLATLFSEGIKSPGYIPQCDTAGQFEAKQCSTNGKVCWCVNSSGQQLSGTVGPSDSVACKSFVKDRSAFARSKKLEESHDCSLVMCDLACEYGYRTDANDCQICECVDPCEKKTCASDEECVIIQEDPCKDSKCKVSATCTKKSGSIPSCTSGKPQVGENNATVNCADADRCDEAYDCEILPGELMGICCQRSTESAETMKDVVTEKHEDKLSTMCEYLRDMDRQGEKLAVPVPSCNGNDGRYSALQCDADNKNCRCVDDFGADLQDLANVTDTTLTEELCSQMRSSKPCYNLLCRLGCDFGFEYDNEGCPICACRNPCKNNGHCSSDEVCQLSEPAVPCSNRWCPPLPKCVSKAEAQRDLQMLCPGSIVGPFVDPETEELLQCDPENKNEIFCPSGHSCVASNRSHYSSEYGFCCPLTESRVNDEANEGWADTQNLRSQQSSPNVGQCPYLIPLDTPIAAMSCELQCGEERGCPENTKCCSNGCGTQCMVPVHMTGCEHSRTVSEHQNHANQKRDSHSMSCKPFGRGFEDTQCHGEFCWCADEVGIEIPGTRSNGPPQVNCSSVRALGRNDNSTCNTECNVNCEFGQKLDSKGCPSSCDCVDPCDDLVCADNEECRLVTLSCVGNAPCPRQALCRPKVENACSIGEPLILNETLVTCGTHRDDCPSTHKCELDIFGEFAVCCTKPREICYSAPPMCVTGEREEISVETKWFFDLITRECRPFNHNNELCHHSHNFFASQEDCKKICPVQTECEAMREKVRSQIKTSPTKPFYMPKCNARLGTWEPVQCLYDLGLCWCVDQQGNQLAGSLTRGTPNCSARDARSLSSAAICPKGEAVHICDAEKVCSDRICASKSNATCRVDPCGGCSAIFFDENNKPVDCEAGLTACQKEAQTVVNSKAWANQGLNTISNLVSAIRELSEDFHEELAQSALHTLFADPLESIAKRAINILPNPHELLQIQEQANQERSGRSRREANSDELSDYDDPAARAMNFFHQVRKRPSSNQEPVADFSSPPKVVIPMRAPIIMVVHRRIVPQMSAPNPMEIMQALSSGMSNLKLFTENSPTVFEPAKESNEVPESAQSHQSNLPMGAGPTDPAMFMSHITALMNNVLGGQPQTQGSERIVVRPNFAEVRMTIKADSPVPTAALQHVENASLDGLLNYLFGHQQSRQIDQGSMPVLSVQGPTQDDSERAGHCPQGNFAETIRSMVGGCRQECESHSDCSSNEKCCQYGCSSTCVTPVTSEAVDNKVKPGKCPVPAMSAQCLYPKVQCMSDGHCAGDQKCCRAPCGSVCETPVTEDTLVGAETSQSMPVTMVVAPPVCTPDGSFALTQSQGQLSWCVDKLGLPIDSTLTKGFVACDTNGTVTKREKIDEVCAEGVVPKVCRNECNSAVCFAHPDAMCVADPCNDCNYHFVDPNGDKVDCRPICEQESAQTKGCNADSGDRQKLRYTFNQTSQMCESFQYDCHGNDNNFETSQECEQQCKRVKSVCELPKEQGLCKASRPAWYYNAVTQQCEEFLFGGCGGNANNFETKSMCEMTCPDLVICPYDTVTKEGLTKEPCDRVKACAASVCAGKPNAICQVDPCDCRATWLDSQTGEPQDCSAETTSLNSVETASIGTRCLTMKKKNSLYGQPYVPECDSEGSFLPTQCILNLAFAKPECWCVDSAGFRSGEVFSPGSKKCDFRKIDEVKMDIAFASTPGVSAMPESKTEFREKLTRTLRSIGADVSGEIVLKPNDDKMLHAEFAIAGTNCDNVAFKIEQIVLAKMLQVDNHVADFKKSRFMYVVNENDGYNDDKMSENVEVIYSADKNEVLAVKRHLEPRVVDARTTTLAAAILAITVAMCILLLLTILMHRNQAVLKKEAFNSSLPGAVAFQNPVYALWTNKVMSAVCRRSPVPSPPESPDHLSRLEAQNEPTNDNNDEVDNEFNNPSYDEDLDVGRAGHQIKK